MERKIGEIFEYNGEWYQCIEGRCRDCYFSEKRFLCKQFITKDFCTSDIIFKKLEKVGEPYTTFVDKTVQNYLLETAVSVPPKDVFTLINNEQRLIAIGIKQTKDDMEEKELNLKEFNLEAAKAGKPVCTRDGRKARIICFDAKRKDEKNIIALVPSKDYPGFEDLISYPNNGNYHGGHENDGDLMMLPPEKKEGWMNVYKERIYSTKEEAIQVIYDGATYIDTIKFSWEE